MIRFACPRCGKAVSAPEDCVGRSSKCPQCGRPLTVPTPSLPGPPIPKTTQETAWSKEAAGKNATPRLARPAESRRSSKLASRSPKQVSSSPSRQALPPAEYSGDEPPRSGIRDVVWVVVPVLVLGPLVAYGSFVLFRPSPKPSVEMAVAAEESNKRAPADVTPGKKDEETDTERRPTTNQTKASRQAKAAPDAKDDLRSRNQGGGLAKPSPPEKVNTTKPPESKTGVKSKPEAERNSKPETKPKPKPKEELQPSPQTVAFFRKLANRLSFPYYWREKEVQFPLYRELKVQGPPEPTAQRYFIPFCSNYRVNSEAYIQLIKSELTAYEELLQEEDPKFRKAVEESRNIFLLRVILGLLNERYGLTKNTSIGITRAAIWNDAWRNTLQRDNERTDFENAQQTANEIRGKLKSADELTAVAKYADMDAADQAAELWLHGLMPWTRKTAGTSVTDKLVSVEPKWENHSLLKQRFTPPVLFQALHHLSITNVSGNKLTHVIVEARVSNEWKDKAANYYYIPKLEVGATCHLKLHPRWVSRRLYSRDMTLNYSVWAAERSNVDSTLTINNPKPPPDVEEYRMNILDWDNGHLGKLGSSLAKGIHEHLHGNP